MNPQAALLQATIDTDIEEIEALYQRLTVHASSLANSDQVILAGYYLHHLYSAFKIFA